MDHNVMDVTYMEVINKESQESTKAKESKLFFYRIIKRIFDIFCAIIGLIFLLPVALVTKISYMISGDFHGIFFAQKRIGKNGKEFNFYKFRTMVPNADEILFKLLKENKEMEKEYKINKKLKNDPRITKMGRILRRTSLDELPQMINILFGSMSLIGNRPYLPREKEDMGKYYNDIIKSKPGITGYWQTSGRSNIDFKSRLKLECYYSQNMSLLLDIKIFFKTFSVVLFGRGAQ